MRISVLALQGAFAEHRQMLRRLGVETFEVRRLSDWHQPKDALIIPGGESTVQLKLLRDLELLLPIRDAIMNGLPVFGTCAGLILLAKQVENDSHERISTMDIEVKRNAYGRQSGSFITEAPFSGTTVPMSFIRAPYISHAHHGVEVLSEVDGKIVAAREDNQLVTAFHPELTDDLFVHSYFLQMIQHKL